MWERGKERRCLHMEMIPPGEIGDVDGRVSLLENTPKEQTERGTFPGLSTRRVRTTKSIPKGCKLEVAGM